MKLPKICAGIDRFRMGHSTKEKTEVLPSAWGGISVGDIVDPGGVVGVVGGLVGGGGHASGAQVEKFAKCMAFPNRDEASACLGSLLACTAAGPAYKVCVGSACGIAGAGHANRCATKAGIIGRSGGRGGSGGGFLRDFRPRITV